MLNYYAILGIKKNATANEIRKAYKQLSLMYHPDKIEQKKKCRGTQCEKNSPCSKDCQKVYEESNKKISEITEAKRILDDPHKRELYDRFGKAEVGSQITKDSVIEIRIINYDLDLWKDFIISMVIGKLSERVTRVDENGQEYVSWEDYDLGPYDDWKEKIRSLTERSEINNYLQGFFNWGKRQNYASFPYLEQELMFINQFCQKVAFNDSASGTYWVVIILVSFLLVATQASELFYFYSRWVKNALKLDLDDLAITKQLSVCEKKKKIITKNDYVSTLLFSSSLFVYQPC